MKLTLIILGAFVLGFGAGVYVACWHILVKQRQLTKSLHASSDALDRAVKTNQQPKDKQ